MPDIIGGNVQRVESGDIHISGKIDDHSLVVLESTGGSITVDGKIDGNSHVTLKAAGNVTIGTQGGDGDKKIDGNSQVEVVASGNIKLGSYIHKATVDFSAHGTITVTEIDYGATVRQIADGDLSVTGKIDGGSRVDLVSNRGSVMVDGKIDGESKVSLTAGMDINIGLGKQGGDDDHKIDGNSFVVASAGGNIALGGGIFKDHTTVDFAAAGSVSIAKRIAGGATVRLLSAAKAITVTDGFADSSTSVTFSTGVPKPQNDGGAQFHSDDWAPPAPLSPTVARNGYWWENWGQTFGYVAPFRVVPRSVDDIVAAVIGSGNVDRPDHTPVKAVGGGWSFSDAALPFQTQVEVDQASIRKRGEWQRQDLRDVLKGLGDRSPSPMDLVPGAVARNATFSTAYDQPTLREVTSSGAQLPASANVRLIDTRSLASSLQDQFADIRADVPVRTRLPREVLFHVEAGITMADLQQLLDHQHPRLALRASGGSPGATLAGALSTATHGGEFLQTWPLLVDCVRAVHLVGPGGEQWWIEGDVPVANQANLQKHYSKIDVAHFISAGWNAIPGLTAQDVLKAVVVSMGTMGVVYSMVLAVVPQFGLRQVVHPTSWTEVLAQAKVTVDDLRASDAKANQAVLDVLIDGNLNGTGIAKADNVYVDLAINPFNGDCWVVNRQLTPALPDDANSPSPGFGDYITALTHALTGSTVDTVQESKFAGRFFDFLSWPTSVPSVNLEDDIHVASSAGSLMSFITRSPNVLVGALATFNVQAVTNVINASDHPDRGQPFLGDLLSGFFHALEGTAPGLNSDRTGVSYQVGAIGWPDGGLPGRGLEIALDQTNAFTFLQTVLFDDVLATTMSAHNNPLFGYISIRVCPPTQTLMGMQQYAPQSVMIEVVAYRSPEANAVVDAIQDKTVAWIGTGPRPLLHWGLENDRVTSAFLAASPLGQPYKGTLSKLDAFKQIRNYLKRNNAPVFDNNFSARLGL